VGVERNESKSSGVNDGVWVCAGSGGGGEVVNAPLLLVAPECGEKQLRRRVARSTYCLKIWKIGPSCLGWPNGISHTSRAYIGFNVCRVYR